MIVIVRVEEGHCFHICFHFDRGLESSWLFDLLNTTVVSSASFRIVLLLLGAAAGTIIIIIIDTCR